MSFITAINSKSGARQRWIFCLEEHLLLLYDLFQRARHLHPHNSGWGTCVRTHKHKICTLRKSSLHKFRNEVSVSPWDLFVPGKISSFFQPPRFLLISTSASSTSSSVFPTWLIVLISQPCFLFFALQESFLIMTQVRWITSKLPIEQKNMWSKVCSAKKILKNTLKTNNLT